MKKVGILGGGQLGLMLYQASLSYPSRFFFLDADSNCPCSQVASNFTYGDFKHYETVLEFGSTKDVISIEIEDVNIKALKKLKKIGKKVIPDPEVLEMIQNKRQNLGKFNDIFTIFLDS